MDRETTGTATHAGVPMSRRDLELLRAAAGELGMSVEQAVRSAVRAWSGAVVAEAGCADDAVYVAYDREANEIKAVGDEGFVARALGVAVSTVRSYATPSVAARTRANGCSYAVARVRRGKVGRKRLSLTRDVAPEELEVVRELGRHELSAADAGNSLGVHASTARRWAELLDKETA
jgi:DNA-binding CsgD family transcriptional regulator